MIALVRAHDDEASWQVFEDWLLETNDPRAPLVRLEKAGEDATSAYAELAPLLFGPLRHVVTGRGWRAGYARAARAVLGGDHVEYTLSEAPALALVRELELEVRAGGEGALLAAATASASAAFGAQLEALSLDHLGERPGTLDAALLTALVGLERLRLGGAALTVIPAPVLARVRELDLALSPRAVVELLRAGRFDELRTLTVRTGTLLYPWHDAFESLLEGTSAPRLESLRLEASPTPASIDFLRDLSRSPLAARLRTLTFAGTACSPESLRRLGRSIANLSEVAP
ncbi:MAG: hypothetical protein U0270_32180 [Labilithrix sp.]